MLLIHNHCEGNLKKVSDICYNRECLTAFLQNRLETKINIFQ